MRKFWQIYGACQAIAGAISSVFLIIQLFVLQKIPQPPNIADLIQEDAILLVITVCLTGSGIYFFRKPE